MRKTTIKAAELSQSNHIADFPPKTARKFKNPIIPRFTQLLKMILFGSYFHLSHSDIGISNFGADFLTGTGLSLPMPQIKKRHSYIYKEKHGTASRNGSVVSECIDFFRDLW